MIASKSHDTQSQLANHHLISPNNENTSNPLHKNHKSRDANNLNYVKRFNINKSVLQHIHINGNHRMLSLIDSHAYHCKKFQQTI